MKNYNKKILSVLIVFVLLISCSKNNNPVEPHLPVDKIIASGTVDLPSGTNSSDFRVKSGLNESDLNNNAYNIQLNKNTVQMVGLYNLSDTPILLNITIANTENKEITLNAETTLEALIFLNPLICSSDKDEATQILNSFKALSSFNSAVAIIQGQLDNGSFSLDASNVILFNAIQNIYEDFYEKYETELTKKISHINKTANISPNPDFEVNGLVIENYSENNGDATFNVSNRYKRWISVFVDKSTDGSSFNASSEWVDLIPSPNISIWNLFKQGINLPAERSKDITTSTQGFQKIAIKCYGMGILNGNSTDEELTRAILPAAMTGVFDLGIPLFEVVTGLKLSVELRGAPANHPFYKLVTKVAQSIVTDIVKKAKFYTWYREGNIVKILAEISKSVFDTVINEPSYVADILTQTVGRSITRSAVNSCFGPFRIMNAVFTVANLSYTIASVLSTEAVTTFILEDYNNNIYPITIKGIVKDFENSTGISNATITVYNSSGNIFNTVFTSNDGSYEFPSNYGIVNLRVVAHGYKVANQNLDIHEDLIIQSPPVYYAPTTWLSPYTNEVGNIGGTVKDATNLNPISNVNVVLRFGVNDPIQEIVDQKTSSSNGTYSFSNLSSGTYTAYFSKEDYIDDFLVVTVLGNQSTGGFDINLSPNISTNGGYRVILTWGQYPTDLDSHLFTPIIFGNNYHVYYSDEGDLSNPPYASLDVDDITSYGPETVTISQVFSGIYNYSVYNFSKDAHLTNSSASVSLYGENGFIRSWSVPLSGNGEWWNVFEINGATGQITTINQIIDNAPGSNVSIFKEDFDKVK
ncbi:MAG: carboxypeptidase regulatory-like domain-containing protein [Candidatus Cloacimonetes bacterium]|nr:carboxypeptidase regulatory-like domain-containing protein [Candidatus Cloacimonadota bacterium]MCF8262299.1 carboxypeptidase regulatory-like domain-containing protein [Melioribacteraceae bacterium]